MTSLKSLPNDHFTVFVVDPDIAFRDAITLTLGYRGYCLRQFSCRADFMAARAPDWRGCVLANIAQVDGSGLDFLQKPVGRRKSDLPLPVVLIGSETRAEMVRAAFLAGAIDVLPMPVSNDELLFAIDRAMSLALDRSRAEPPRKVKESVSDVLTKREIEVANLVRQGFDNRTVADRLGISHRTVEVHKTRLMRKLGVNALAELIALPALVVPRRKMRRRNQAPIAS